MTDHILLWIHLLAMAGALGGAYVFQKVIDPAAAGSAEAMARCARLINLFLGAGFLAGLALYYQRVTIALRAGFSIGTTWHAIIGLKLLLLLGAGALIGISSKRTRDGRPDTARKLLVAAAAVLAVAMFLGIRLRAY
jgi:uncharacterized membrane protein